ncbi:MAG: hypothetical protein ABI647_11205 [Gemmatimonadota bacterium]
MSTAAVRRSALPIPFYFMILSMLATGAMAGIVASAIFPVAAVLLSVVLVRAARREINTTSGAANDPMIEALRVHIGWLPDGAARELLAEVAVASDQLLAATVSRSARVRLHDTLEPLLEASATAARDLSQLTEQLAWLEAQPSHSEHLPDAWAKALAETRTARDRLSGLLLELSTALGRARALAAGGFDSAGAELAELCREFEGMPTKPAG